MPHTPPVNLPLVLYIGDQWEWLRNDLSTEFPNADWDIVYYFNSRNPPAKFSVTGTAEGTGFKFTVLPAASSQFSPSDRDRRQSGYEFHLRAEHKSDGRVFTIERGRNNISLDLSIAKIGHDPRSWAEAALDALEARLVDRADEDQLNYSINGRQVGKMTPEQLRAWHSWFKSEMANIKGPRPVFKTIISRGDC